MTDKRGLSPGQSLTRIFPVVGETKPSSQIGEWSLKITGLTPRELEFSLAEFWRLPTVERVWDTVCVTGWRTSAGRICATPTFEERLSPSRILHSGTLTFGRRSFGARTLKKKGWVKRIRSSYWTSGGGR